MKKNNKGFSLVELIVVVLIMGILAVALAPQVTKWVDNSKIAADNSAYESLFAEAQLVVVNKAARTALDGATYELRIGTDGTTLWNTSATTPAPITDNSNAVLAALTALDGSWGTAKAKNLEAGEYYAIAIGSNGTVTKVDGKTPVIPTDFEN